MRLLENRRYSMGVSKNPFFAHPSRIDDFPCNLTQFCYSTEMLGFCMHMCNVFPSLWSLEVPQKRGGEVPDGGGVGGGVLTPRPPPTLDLPLSVVTGGEKKT